MSAASGGVSAIEAGWLMASRWCLVIPLCLVISGCADVGGAAVAGRTFVVNVPSSAFYKYGPAQAFGADLNLSKGEKVTMVKREFGFSQIRLANNETGYVATDELKELPPEPKAKATPAPRIAKRGAPRAKPAPEPQLDLSDLPIPALPTQ